MSNKFFTHAFILLSGISIMILSQLSYRSYTENSLTQKSEERILKAKKTDSQIAFVGDSSLEYGIDENYFSSLLNGIKVDNLSLTADAHNLSGTFNIIRHLIKNNTQIKYIIIMQNPSIWYTGFSEGGYCTTVDNLTNENVINEGFLTPLGCFTYKYMNMTALKTLSEKKKVKSSSEEVKTYKNGQLDINKELNEEKFYKYKVILPSKEKELKMIDNYLENKNIKVFYVQGPLHYKVFSKYEDIIHEQHIILKKLKNIHFIETYLYPQNEFMGNSENHVDNSYKLEATKFYYSILKEYLLF